MRVVYCLTRSDTIGGYHVHVLDLARWMQDRGAEVRVVVGGTGPFCDHLSHAGIAWTSLASLRREIDPVRDVAATWALSRTLRRLRPDLVSLHSSKAGILGRLTRLASPRPVVFTAHGWSFTPGIPQRDARRFRRVERLAAPLASRIITVSEHDRQLALRHRVTQPWRLVTVRNGTRASERPCAAQHDAGDPLIVCVARLEPQKDHPRLLEALSRLRDRPWKLELIGDGPLQEALETRATALGIRDRIKFAGLCQDVEARLARAQLFVLPSHWEGLPISVLEAMSVGLPVLASNVGGTSEAIEHAQTGYLIDPGDTDGWTAKLRQLLEHPGERTRLGTNARERHRQRFTLERMARETAWVYESLTASRRPGHRP
ncbi:MAG: glycosyltransferase family 4 protein [Halorhodospira halophila]|uniref:glycosyltransferase family 4 protein n=1 Tax=Halorhodospira halophila TaxID=1053 RepID=UPI0026EA1D30|nr:glycosyltransferase family 4 protein [Halorhodospira halophila]MCC3751088.1 glycosyltransferase family 4 protein [Halorhodospira halophila]